MTVQEASKCLDEIEKIGKQALKELEQYRALGTVEELKEAKGKADTKNTMH